MDIKTEVLGHTKLYSVFAGELECVVEESYYVGNDNFEMHIIEKSPGIVIDDDLYDRIISARTECGSHETANAD